MTSRRALFALTLLAILAAAVALLAHLDSARLFTHTCGVFLLLAELLRDGVLYPNAASADLVYATFYHPLGFAPYALLPGSGLELARSMRLLVGLETLACLFLATRLWRPAGGAGVRLQPALWALCTVPVCFALVGMRDDPRALLFGLLALLAFGSGRHTRPVLAGVLLGLAFFTKATAPFAPGLALLWAARREGGGPRRARALRLVLAAAATIGGSVVFLQWGLGCDFLHNGLYYMVVEPPGPGRPLGAWLTALGTDLTREAALPVLLTLAGTGSLLRLARGRADRFDVLLFAGIVKTVAVYRSYGTDLNHLLDVAVFAAIALARQLRAWLTASRALVALALALGLGAPWRWLVPEPGTTTLAESPLAAAAAALRAQPETRTLCEEPLLGWLAGVRPITVDPFLTLAALRRDPGVWKQWFGPVTDARAVRRLILMHDPRRQDPAIEHWYAHLHFDAAFLAMVRAEWQVALVTDTATVLVR